MMKKCFKSFWRFGKKKYTYAVNKNTTMIDKKTPIKVAGYLEKRSKMKVVCRWKKLWFVLEGRLLLYYKSQLEYLSLSPCRGTVNLGLAASVAPGKSNEIIVSTRSNTVSLRALNRSDHDIWLQALMDAMHLPNASHSICCSKPVRHFRYSTGGLEEQHIRTYGDYFTNHAHTLSGRLSPIIPRHSSDRRQNGAIDLKLEKLARRFNKIAASDNTIPENFKITSRDSLKNNLLRRSISVEDEINRYPENIYETVDSTRFQNRNPKRVIRSDSDCLLMRERLSHQPVFRSEQKIKSIFDSSYLNDRDLSISMLNKNRVDKGENRIEKLFKMKLESNGLVERKKDIKSDTDLTLRKSDDVRHTGSCNVVYRPIEHLPSNNSHEYCLCSDCIRNQDVLKQPIHIKPSKKPKRSNSILKHFMRNKNDVCSPLMKKNSVKRRSLSFLKKIWRKKEPKFEDDISFNTEENDMQEIHVSSCEMAGSCNYSAVEMCLEYEAPLPEPVPDYCHADQAPELPPRRGPTPWDEPSQSRISLEEEQPPALPIKKRKRKGNALDCLFQDGYDSGLRFLFNESEDNSQKELGEIMAQLADINAAPLKYTNDQDDEDPDYDIPRPHDSLLLDLPKTFCSPDKMQPTNFFSHFEDSLDLPQSRFEEFTMAPDSLECDPWSLSESESTSDNWTPQTQIRKAMTSSTYSSQETFFKDSLNLPNGGKNYLNIQNNYIQLHS
ncbi:unnamed protein product [Nezara viridula]|uniref:PH domain-containing protein n=2 Tax=Nezara viridula TaxID=85310 RepID=A0A9P0HHQ2_NEZVI|nr:unnamed protein product [Nezara viridula]